MLNYSKPWLSAEKTEASFELSVSTDIEQLKRFVEQVNILLREN